MEPAFYRGDILFLTNPANTPYDIGDITVYKVLVALTPPFEGKLTAAPATPSEHQSCTASSSHISRELSL